MFCASLVEIGQVVLKKIKVDDVYISYQLFLKKVMLLHLYGHLFEKRKVELSLANSALYQNY